MAETSSCPWDAFSPGTLQFCEAHLCSWVRAPAETASNLGYIFVGAALLRKNGRSADTGAARILGLIAVLVGIFSAIYHASHLWLTEVFDLGAMSFLSIFLLAHVLVRVGALTAKNFWDFWTWGVALSWLALFFTEGVMRLAVFTVAITIYVILEMRFGWSVQKQTPKIRYGAWVASILLFLASFVFWLLDFYRIGCVPERHFVSGHAVWHALNAFCFWTLATYLRQFDRVVTLKRYG